MKIIKLKKKIAVLISVIFIICPFFNVLAEETVTSSTAESPTYSRESRKFSDRKVIDKTPVYSPVNNDQPAETKTDTGTKESPQNSANNSPQETSSNTSENNSPTSANNEKTISSPNENSTENKAENSQTGANSENNSEINLNNEVDIKNNNHAEPKNSVRLRSESGNNNANYNTGHGFVATGDADAFLNVLNFVNTNFLTLPGKGMVFIYENIYKNFFGDYIVDDLSGETYTLNGSRVLNENTGANSENNSTLNANNILNIDNKNSSKLNNNLDISTSTGNNSASYNTGNGTISTGDANAALNLFNFLNSNITALGGGALGVFNIFGSWVGNLFLPESLISGQNGTVYLAVNDSTGTNSVNNSNITSNNTLDINNNNYADINNKIKLGAETGNNEASFNTGGGSILTGDSLIKLTNSTIANQNIVGDTVYIILVNVLGEWLGSNLFSNLTAPLESLMSPVSLGAENTQTGANSGNNSDINLNNNVDIKNNNNAKINNNININADTGNNSASYNTGNGSVTTGNASILANILNFINFNVVAQKAVIMIVNVFGDWAGNIDIFNPNNNQNMGGNPPQINPIPGQENRADKPVSILSGKNVVHKTSIPNYFNSPISTNTSGADMDKGTEILSNADENLSTPIVKSQSQGNKEDAASFLVLIKDNLKLILFVAFLLYLFKVNRYLKRKREEKI